ncbi:MAG TPA: PAS domain-containing protein [Balneolaceae bacterium]
MVKGTKESLTDSPKTNGRRKEDQLLEEQTRLLELIASGKPLEECLSALCSAIPRLNPGVRASVLLADEQRKAFKRPIAPELLPSFGEGLEGAPINDLCIGTCGEAVFSGEPVICEDIKNDEKWSKEWRELCVSNDILGCQSTPVFGEDGNAQASFMLCFNKARTSNEWEERLSEFGAHIIKIALERERSNKALLKHEEELRKSREQFEMAARAGSVGTWTWDIKEDIVATDKYLAEAYGVDPEKAAAGATMKSFYESIHEDDEEKTWNRLMKAVEETGELEAEYRVQNGDETLWILARGKVEYDKGEPLRMRGTISDITARKRQEEKLRQSEERFRAFVEASSDVVYRMSPDWKEMYHLDGRNFIADTHETSSTWLDEYIHSGDQERVKKAIDKTMRTKSIFDLEHRVLQVDGALGWTHSRAIPILDGEGELIEWFGTARDVTEHKKIEEALKASEEKYRALFDSMDEGYCIIEMIFDDNDKPVDYRFVEVNDAFEQQSGMSNVTGKRMLEFVSDIEEHWLENYGQVALTGEPIRFLNEYKSLNRWFDVYAFQAEGWSGNKVAVLFSDVTEQKQAEQLLRESKEHLELAVEVALIGTWNYDIETDFVHLDERMCEIWGVTETTIPLAEVVEHIHSGDREQVAAAITAALDPSSDGTYNVDYRIVWDDGTIRWVSANGRVQFSGEEREAVGFFGTALDVTERKQAEKKAKFRSTLTDVLRPLTDPAEIKADATRVLCEYLDADRSLYAEVEADGEHAVIERDYTKGIPSMAGRIRLDDFGPTLMDEMRRGDIHIQINIGENPDLTEQEKKNYQGIGIQAQVGVPFMKNGQLLSILGVHQSEPREWTDDEIDLMEETAERTWAAVERARVETDLQRSEARLKTVLKGSEVGAWDLNLEDQAAWRSIEHDRIFGYDTLLPEWTYEIFMEHVLPEDREMVDKKFNDALEGNGRWDFECRIMRKDGEKRWIWARGQVYHRNDDSLKRMLGTVQDITERKQAEKKATFRATLTDALRPLEDPEAIKNEATRILGEHLGVSRALYADVEEDEIYISVKQNYVDGVSPVTGRFRLDDFGRELMDDIRAGITLTVSDVNDFDEEPRLQEAERGAYDAVGVQAYAAVPLIKDGKLVAYLGFHQSEPRNWTDDEIALMEETAERTWAAVERARTEQQMQQSEYQYRTLFESIDEGYCIIQVAFDENDEPVNYKVVEANPAAKSLIGAMKVEGKSAREILPEEQVFSFETYGKVVLTREPIHFERHAQSLDRYFSISVYPYGQPKEQKAAVLFNDTTARKRSEQAIRQNSERLKAVLRGSTVGAWDFNVESDTSWHSPEYDRIFGYDSIPEWSFEKFMEHVLPEDRERVDREYSDVLNGNGMLLDLEFQIRRADGEKRWIWSHGQVIREDDSGSPKRVIGTVQDITGRKREEMNSHFLAGLSKELQAISDPDEIMAATAEMLGEHLEVDRCAYAEVEGDEDSFTITGDYTRGDMISIVGNWQMSAFGSEALRLMRKNDTYVVHDVDKDERITQDDLEAYEQTKIEAVICVPLHKAGKFVAGMAVHRNKPYHWLPQEVSLTVQVVNRCWEAIERARINRDLEEMNETLEERVDERTSALLSYQKQLRLLATRLSKAEEEERRRLATELHDNLGQILAVTKMKVDLMEKTQSLSDLTETSELMDEAISYTRELMSELKPPPQLGEEDISTNLDWLAKKMKKYDLNVMFEGVEGPEPLDEDIQTTLVQAVRELLFNVVKHTGDAEARVVLSYPDDHLKITVKDNGAGFDVNSIDIDLSKGGFGLFNIRERIDLLGGHMEVESVPGEGTTVTLLVPLTAEGANALSDGESSRKPQGRGIPGKQNQTKIKVLLVDDHEMMREGLKKIIEQEGDLIVVAEAPDGQSAVELAHETRPDVVIMDINLPGMNGIDATEKIKAELPEMRVIGLSLHNDEEVIREMRNAGASAYLTKSNAFETLCATIRSEGMMRE